MLIAVRHLRRRFSCCLARGGVPRARARGDRTRLRPQHPHFAWSRPWATLRKFRDKLRIGADEGRWPAMTRDQAGAGLGHMARPYSARLAGKYPLASLDQSLRRLSLVSVGIFSATSSTRAPLKRSWWAARPFAIGRRVFVGTPRSDSRAREAIAMVRSLGTPLLITSRRTPCSIIGSRTCCSRARRGGRRVHRVVPLGRGSLTERYLNGNPGWVAADGGVLAVRDLVSVETLSACRPCRHRRSPGSKGVPARPGLGPPRPSSPRSSSGRAAWPSSGTWPRLSGWTSPTRSCRRSRPTP